MKWSKRIQIASKSGSFDEYSKQLAASWSSCSLGEKLGLTHTPTKDLTGGSLRFLGEELIVLGYDFSDAVQKSDIQKAKELHEKIKQYKINEEQELGVQDLRVI